MSNSALINFLKLLGDFWGILEFETWKTNEEKTTDSYSTKTSQKVDRIYYDCNRSGNYAPKPSRERHMKIQGSRKINARCPAGLRVHKTKDNVRVNYTKTHVGHTVELNHLNIHPDDRKLIAGYMSMGITRRSILERIRSSWSKENFHRIHLTGNQDLTNIRRDFEVDASVRRDRNDLISVESWINEMQSSNSEPILLYQAQEQNNPFMLAISTTAQICMFNKYGSNIIAIDSTHGTNDYDFQLTTVMVVDENRYFFQKPGGFLRDFLKFSN